MDDIKISGRRVSVTDDMRKSVEDKIGGALRVFDIQPMSCDVVLRVDKSHSKGERKACEVTVRARDAVVRVVAEDSDIFAAIDEAASKVSRQMRRYKTRVVDRRKRAGHAMAQPLPTSVDDLAELIETPVEEDDQLVREKYVELAPMTEEEALVQTDLLGHDFYVFENATTGLVNVIYHRRNGGYGIIKPKLEEDDVQA